MITLRYIITYQELICTLVVFLFYFVFPLHMLDVMEIDTLHTGVPACALPLCYVGAVSSSCSYCVVYSNAATAFESMWCAGVISGFWPGLNNPSILTIFPARTGSATYFLISGKFLSTGIIRKLSMNRTLIHKSQLERAITVVTSTQPISSLRRKIINVHTFFVPAHVVFLHSSHLFWRWVAHFLLVLSLNAFFKKKLSLSSFYTHRAQFLLSHKKVMDLKMFT